MAEAAVKQRSRNPKTRPEHGGGPETQIEHGEPDCVGSMEWPEPVKSQRWRYAPGPHD